MAEGGVAAALANVDDRDNWRVHFADTMRGGQYLNNWRMAELHAKEAPECVRELEAWGALFDRTKRRPDSAAQLWRASLSAPGARRRSHRPRDDPHAAGSRHPQRHGSAHGVHGAEPADGLGPHRRRLRLRPREGALLSCGRRRPWCWRRGESAAPSRSPATVGSTPATGLALAYQAGAELKDMEFVQFHPTGMVWPISVRGILVTEGVRGEGGVLRNNEGRRFMFDEIPDLYKEQTADNEEEGWRYTQGDKNARRPPELLTRDHVARCINREVKAGRGTPHGGVFLDIAWIKERMPKAEEHIKRKLPSMYHQFKQLADLDITKEPMEVGPTTHYMMGGISVDGDSQMSTVPGLFAAGEVAAGLHGANRLGGNSLSDLLVFGRRAGRFAAEFAKGSQAAGAIDEAQLQAAAAAALAPFDRGPAGENPYQIQYDLQESMQDLVGIVRTEGEMERALENDRPASCASGTSGYRGPSAVQQRVAHGDGSAESADGIGSHYPRRAASQGEPRRAVSRRLSRQRRRVGQAQHCRQARRGRRNAGGKAPASSRCPRS